MKEQEKRVKKGYGTRPTDKVIDERIDEAVQLLSSKPNVSRYQTHKIFRPRWGNCHWRTVDRILVRARATLIERLNRSREEFRCDVLAAYERELQDKSAGIRLSALSGIRDLLGLDNPKIQHQRITDGEGKPLAPAVIAPVVQFIIPSNNRTKPAPPPENVTGNGNGHTETNVRP